MVVDLREAAMEIDPHARVMYYDIRYCCRNCMLGRSCSCYKCGNCKKCECEK